MRISRVYCQSEAIYDEIAEVHTGELMVSNDDDVDGDMMEDEDEDGMRLDRVKLDIDDLMENDEEYNQFVDKYQLRNNVDDGKVDIIKYPNAYNYGPFYKVSFPINEIIKYCQKQQLVLKMKVYDVHNANDTIVNDKDWFIIGHTASIDDMDLMIKLLIKQGHDKGVARDGYYKELNSTSFGADGENDWCLIDLADTMVLLCDKTLMDDPASTVNAIQDKLFQYFYGTYYPLQNIYKTGGIVYKS